MAAHEVPQDAYLLDVREDDEWAAGHAEGAKHIPMGEVVARLDELANDGVVHVICRAGGRSARVTAYLNSNGWDAINVDGGMQLWQAAGRPLVAESGAEPTVI
ncbi:rhodanese-like domain-containing protein [Crossiella cryophila]|uniref:Rhodanese-related sulfurtransferase n=1 Tax=Crossiella cryophila TaxID=43355 RepID=A0A7W7C5U8_9PSEU|nr:rhodanese-like domain-containing protein [Crossiella cryophila]MBB4675074.1 rhodanese-related sulfurtransferase [Crossiella cryophila]